MARQYLVLVDKRDNEKFRRLITNEFDASIRSVLERYEVKAIWGFHKSQITSSWQYIDKNDQMYFSVPSKNFELVGRVAKKITDLKLGKKLWPNSLDAQQITHFLLFDMTKRIDFLFNKTIDNTIKKIKYPLPGIYEIKTHYEVLPRKSSIKNFIKPSLYVFVETKKGTPPKQAFEITRFLRDSSKVKQLKKLYDNKCQICGFTFEYEKGQFYSEVHHYNPLKANADDHLDNMIVVCPNHHAQFDYNLIAIDHDGTTIIDNNGKKIDTITFRKDHKLNIKNIESQLE